MDIQVFISKEAEYENSSIYYSSRSDCYTPFDTIFKYGPCIFETDAMLLVIDPIFLLIPFKLHLKSIMVYVQFVNTYVFLLLPRLLIAMISLFDSVLDKNYIYNIA